MSKKTLHITFDYELFFGNNSGTVQKCLLEPTDRLLKLALAHNARFVFFVDAGYLWQLKNHLHIPACKADYELVSAQIKKMVLGGHEIGLHIHPHWLDSFFRNGKWNIVTKRYKLADFNEEEIEKIINDFHRAVSEITGKACDSFRAGGWCIQPFKKLKPALEKNRIFIDSSVYKNGYHQFTAQSYDFRNAPNKTEWKFSENECKEEKNGRFTEVSITNDTISPFFYIDLYLRMKLHPAYYKPVGDGSWLKDKKKIYSQFYSYTNHFACCDGFFASRLSNILKQIDLQGKKRMLVLGHPKSMAEYSFNELEKFIVFSLKNGFNILTLNEDFKA